MTKTEIIKLIVAVIIFAVVIAIIAVLGRIDAAQTIQLIITFVLVLVTVTYVNRTSEIAQATRQQADASAKMAEEMREQRYDALRPIIDIENMQQLPMELARQAYAEEPPKELTCNLCNVGVGPAIDVYSFVCHDSGERRRCDLGTIAIGKAKRPGRLSVVQKDDHWFLVVYYKDAYGRCFESSREVSVGVVNPGPLKSRNMDCEELPT